MFQRLFQRPSVEEISVDETRARQQAGAVIVDVRESVEWLEGTIPGARRISLSSLARRVQE